jgi:hypothetical protein
MREVPSVSVFNQRPHESGRKRLFMPNSIIAPGQGKRQPADKNYVRPMEWLWAMAKQSIPSSARVVSSFMIHDVEIVYQGIDYMTENTDLSEKTIRRGVKWLVDNGWLQRIAVGSSFGRGGFSSQYRRLMPGQKVMPMHVGEGFKSEETYRADMHHTWAAWEPEEWNELESTGQIVGVFLEEHRSNLQEHRSNRTPVPENTGQIVGTNRNTKDKRDIETAILPSRGRPAQAARLEADSKLDAATDAVPLEPASEASFTPEIVPPEKIAYWKSAKFGYRWAGKSKPRNGEQKVYLTHDEAKERDDCYYRHYPDAA